MQQKVKQLNFTSMSKICSRVLYAVVNRSMGDTLDALVTVSADFGMMMGASRHLHSNHPFRCDFAVIRSTDSGYFGSSSEVVAINGELVK